MSAVVIGVSHQPGIGFAVAKRFALEGLRVGIVGRQREKLEQCAASIAAACPGAVVRGEAADAGDKDAVSTALGALAEAHGVPEVLVYNCSARPFPAANVADADPASYRTHLDTSVFGLLHAAQAVIPGMRSRGSGTIIVTGATASLRGSAGTSAFSVGKMALRGLAQSLAKEEAPHGIHVCHAVIDGMVDMPLINQFMPDVEEGRLIDSDAVADTYWALHRQPKRCQTFELDIRPHLAKW